MKHLRRGAINRISTSLLARLFICLVVCVAPAVPGRAQDAIPAAPSLVGDVSSAEEGLMEGVLVSAQRGGSTITVTVASDDKGHFFFPPEKLGTGTYDLRIRAAGYELEGPKTATVSERGAAVNLKLAKVADIAPQLTNTDWFISMPGTDEQKRPMIECMSCHTFERIVRSTYSAEEFLPLLKRMAQYANNTIQANVQVRKADRPQNEEGAKKLAAYLETVNLHGRDRWTYELKTRPRPTGRATRMVVTEYKLPRETIAPHDVRTDEDGFVWYSNFVENNLGRLDPRTGAHDEYSYPVVKPGFPLGALALEPDADGNWWLSGMFQTGLYRFDTKTKTFKHFPVSAALDYDGMQQSLMMPGQSQVDGKVWTNDVAGQKILRLDIATGVYEAIDPFKMMPKGRQHSPYGMAADKENNLFFMDFADENVGRVDAKTGGFKIYPTPTRHSRPRRTMIDDKGRVWFAEFGGNKVAMFEPGEERITEWDVPTPHTYPYDVFLDRNEELWSGSMASDRVLRFDPKTGQSIEYLLPNPTNVRRVFIDNTTTPVTFWAGNNHHAAIVKLEPQD